MKWIHVIHNKDRISCPAYYIQDYSPGKELNVNQKYWVFWSSDEKDTPKSYKDKQKTILRITDAVLAKNKGKPVTGYYPMTLLMVKDSEGELDEALNAKRLVVPVKAPTAVSNLKQATAPTKKTRPSRKTKLQASRLNLDDSIVANEEHEDTPAVCNAEDDPYELPPGPTSLIYPKKVQLLGVQTFLSRTLPVSSQEDSDMALGHYQGESSQGETAYEKKRITPDKQASSSKQGTPTSFPFGFEDEPVDEEDFSNKDVPVQAFKDLETKFLEEKASVKDLKNREYKLQLELKALKLQLAREEEEKRKAKESEAKLAGECLRMVVAQKGLSAITTVRAPDSLSEKVQENTSTEKSSENSENVMFDSGFTSISDSDISSPNTSKELKRSLPSPNGLSEELTSKRQRLLEALGVRAKKNKDPKNCMVLDSFSKDYKNAEWALTPEQENALLQSVKKGKKNDALFTKKAISLMWDKEELILRSAKGVAAPSSDGKARPECTPAKKVYLLYLLDRRVEEEAKKKEKDISAERRARATMGHVEGFLSSKITTVRRDLRKSLLKEDEDDDSE